MAARSGFVIAMFVVMVGTVTAWGQPDTLWTRAYAHGGGNYGHAITPTTDGGFVIAGESGVGGWAKFWLLKITVGGDTIWNRDFGLSEHGDNWCASVQPTLDGGYILAGTTAIPAHAYDSNLDYWLLKMSADGDSLWSRKFGGPFEDWCTCVRQTSDRGYVLAGYTYSYGAGGKDMWLVKTDSLGDSLWSRTYGGIWNDECEAVLESAGGGYLLFGHGQSDTVGYGGAQMWLLKTNAAGDSQWCHVYGGDRASLGRSLEPTVDGGYVLAGSLWGRPGGFAGDFWLLKVDAEGNEIWSRSYGGDGAEECESVMPLTDGNYLLAGFRETEPESGICDYWLLKANATGDSVWSRTFGGTADDHCNAACLAGDGGCLLVGNSDSHNNGNCWVVRVASDLSDSPLFSDTPLSLRLIQNYPNPFNSVTEISYYLPKTEHVSLKVFDLLGREVMTLASGRMDAGNHRVTFDGSGLPSGIYVYRLQAGEYSESKKMVLLK